MFVKPAHWKEFNGRACDRHGIGYIDGLRDSTRVWCAEVVDCQCEWRVFVANGVIVGTRRYDGDEGVSLDEQSVAQMVALLNASGSAPSGYALDVGLMAGGHTALVELNDASESVPTAWNPRATSTSSSPGGRN